MGDYENYEPAYLQKVKDQAARHNITLDAGMGCICPLSKSFSKNGPPARDRVLEGLRVAKAVGATSMRCYLGASADRLGRAGHRSVHGEHHQRLQVRALRGAGPGREDRARKSLRRYAGSRSEDDHRGGRQGLRRLLSRHRQSDVVRGGSVRHAGNAGAIRSHDPRARLGGVRNAARRRRAMGRARRRLRGHA